MHAKYLLPVLAAALLLVLSGVAETNVLAQNEGTQQALDALESAMDAVEAPATTPQQARPTPTAKTVRPLSDPPTLGRNSTYTNNKFHYLFHYPKSLLIPQGESDSGDGQRFVSRDRKVVLLAWGYANYNGESVRQNYASMQESVDFRVTYKRQKGDWFVLSGVDQDGIVYLKRWVHADFIVTLQMHYPPSMQSRVDPVLQDILKSVRLW